MRTDNQTFNDGIITITKASERKIIETKLSKIRFGEKTVGVQRYWQAKVAGDKVDRVIAIPYSKTFKLSTSDVVLIDSENEQQYEVIQTQEKKDTTPPSIYLSLRKIVQPYADRR